MSGATSDETEGRDGEEYAEDVDEADAATPVEELGFDPTDPDKPLLIWDGTCGFCARSLEYVRDRAGDELHYVPYQRVHEHFEALDAEDFARAVHLVEPGGIQTSGAEAIYRALSRAPDGGLARSVYENVSLFARASESGYRFVANNRPLVSKLTRWTVGEDLRRPEYRWARWIFMRLLAVILAVAFVSLGSQILGLIGSGGIEPAATTVEGLRGAVDESERTFGELFWQVPTLFWWWEPTDSALTGLCWTGAGASALLFAGVWPRLLLPVVWVLYLSLSVVSGPFVGYQWDILLLETSVLAWLFAPAGIWTLRRAPPADRAPLWLFHWLAFRLMFMSGVAKLLGGDPTWRNMSALSYHFWTQPLPTWTAYWVHQLPTFVLYVGTFLTLVLEVAVPLLALGPRRCKRWAAAGLIGLQVAILATGNYTFFNLLTIAVCLLLIDDAVWKSALPTELQSWLPAPKSTGRSSWEWVRSWGVAVTVPLVFGSTCVKMLDDFHETAGEPKLGAPSFVADLAEGSVDWARVVDGLRSFNNYGLFVDMTTSRPELIVQGSADGERWESYEFRWKPDELDERPRFVQPHQPRLDWQMWFQALRLERVRERTGRCRPSPWFLRFQRRLLEGSEAVSSLLAADPFEDSDPRYVRVVVYDYSFADPGSDDWWRRTNRRIYCPVYRLDERGVMRRATRLTNSG